MNKPTLEEYGKAKEAYEMYLSWIKIAREHRDDLIDNLAMERANELRYLEQAEHYREIIVAYETYERIEKGGTKQ